MSEQFAEQADAVVDNDTSGLDSEPSEILDEDRLGEDPLEDGMDTAEGYSRQVRLGGTQDAEDQDSLAYRIPQEEPDVVVEEQPDRPVAATPAMDLDESVDDPANSPDGVGDQGRGPQSDPLDPDGAVEDELLTANGGEIELGLSSAEGAAEPGGLPTDDSYGEAIGVENEWPTEGAEGQAMHIEQES